MISEDALAGFASEYEALAGVAQESCAYLETRVSAVLDGMAFSLAVPTVTRFKSWHSVRQKLVGSTRELRSLYELQDLIGARVTLLFSRDTDRVCDLLAGGLSVVRRYDTGAMLAEDQFGYASTHIVVAIPPIKGVPAEDEPLLAEIQVRTVAQHLWAAASHVLQYKRESAVPPPVRRAVHRVAALLETVDLELERVLEQREEYSAEQPELNSDEALNVDLLRGTLDAFWPSAHRIWDEPYGLLLDNLEEKGLSTPKRLFETIHPYRAAVLAYAADEAQHLAFVADRHGVRNGEIRYREGHTKSHTIHVTDEIVRRAREGVFFSHTGLTWGALALADGQKLRRHH